MPPELPDGVQDSLREAGDSLRSTTGKLAAAMTQGRQQVDSRARELQKDRCNWLVNNALPQFTVLADQCSRQLGQALFDVSKAYLAAPERELATRHAKWRDEFEARRTAALADLEAVQQSCTAMISAAESDPAGDSLAKAEQSIKRRLEEWHAKWAGVLQGLVSDASQDLLSVARDAAGRVEP
jgi:hypothetical protein